MLKIHLPFLFSLMLVLGLSSCLSTSQIEYQVHDISNLFSIELPDYQIETTELNPEAECQFQNSLKNFCILVRKNNWTELSRRRPNFVLEDFYDVSIEQLKGSLDQIDAPAPDSINLNGLPTFLGTLSGDFKGDRITFNIGAISGRNYLYQLLVWTAEEERDFYKKDIDRLIQSFRELPSAIQIEEIQ